MVGLAATALARRVRDGQLAQPAGGEGCRLRRRRFGGWRASPRAAKTAAAGDEGEKGGEGNRADDGGGDDDGGLQARGCL